MAFRRLLFGLLFPLVLAANASSSPHDLVVSGTVLTWRDLPLPGAVSDDLSRGAVDAQELGGIAKAAIVIEIDFQQLLGALETYLDGPVGRVEAHPGVPGRSGDTGSSSSERASSTSMIGMPSRMG